jgi:hypothetical protein
MNAEKQEQLLTDASRLLGQLFVSRRDAKAVFKNGQWLAVREKFKKSDFRNHLFGSTCLGSYLLNNDSTVKFIAFDIDLLKQCKHLSDCQCGVPYYVIRDLDEIEAMEANGEYQGELDPDTKRGNLEAALHDPTHEGHRWAASLVTSVAASIRERIDGMGLSSLTVITGGGAHVLVPFGEYIPAAEGRSIAHGVMDEIPHFHKRSESFYANSETDPNVEVEVFPKQDALKDPESLGNLIRLPLGMHECGIRTYILDTSVPRVPTWGMPKVSSMTALTELARKVGLEVPV